MLRSLLSFPVLYQAFSKCLGVEATHRQLVNRTGYLPGMRILDIGCGTGDLAKHFCPHDYVGIDLSEQYIQHARKNSAATFHVLSAERIGELDDSFDLAVMFGVFHHLS